MIAAARPARALPAMVAFALMIALVSCKGSIFPESNGNSPTSSPSPGSRAFAYVTNFATGKLSRFRRNTSTGALNLRGSTDVGASNGPRGLAVHPSRSFLYVANAADHRTYQFAIDPGDGSLSPIAGGFINNGAGAGTDQIAIDRRGRFAWATNFANGTISGYAIDSSTGALSANGTVVGLVNPFGIAAHPTLDLVFIADAGLGVVLAFSFDSAGLLTQLGAALPSLGFSNGTPGLMAIDAAGDFLFVADLATGVVASFEITTTGLVFGATFSTGAPGNQPIGIILARTATAEFLFTANRSGHSISEFTNNAGFLTFVGALAGVTGATGLATDPANAFLYVTGQDTGTVVLLSIEGACAAILCIEDEFNTQDPPNPASAPQFIALTG
jgi:6-phosphogluconolactonase (cycloisomerase 2 family)